MAIRKRKRAGSKAHSYTVTWREGGARDGAQRGVTVHNAGEAARIEAAIIANGHRLPAEYAHLLRGASRPVAEPVDDDQPAGDGTAPTFAAYAAEYVEHLTGITTGYRRQFALDVARHMAPAFGDMLLTAITRRHVKAWLRGLEAGTHPWLQRDVEVDGEVVRVPRPLAYRSRKRLATQAGAVMRAAIDDDELPGVVRDPFSRLRIGKPEHGASQRELIKALTPAEWQQLHDQLPAGVYRDLATVAVGTGLRFGELTALQVRHVILDGPGPARVEVRQAWKPTRAGKGEAGDRYELGTPKSRQSIRDVTVDPTVAEVLRRLTAGRPPFALVFTTPATSDSHARRRGGAPIRANNYNGRVWLPAVRAVWPPALDEAGQLVEAGRRVRFHDLRHTHASWLIAAGRPLTEIQRRLGHSTIQLTSDTYGHLLPDPTDAAVAAIEAALSRPAELRVIEGGAA